MYVYLLDSLVVTSTEQLPKSHVEHHILELHVDTETVV